MTAGRTARGARSGGLPACGAGGAIPRRDHPEGVYCSTPLRLIEDEWPGDLFMNPVTAAVED